MEIEDAMKETSPVLSGFDLFNPEAVDESKENQIDLLKTFCDYYGTSINDSYKGQATTAAPIINSVHATSEFEDFMEAFDDTVSFLNKKLKKSAKQLVGENNDSETYIKTKRTTSANVYKCLAADGSLKQFINIAALFKTSLLIPPTTSNIKHGFSIINLICIPLRTSSSESNVDCFMQISINGPERFGETDIEKIVDIFKRTNDNRHLHL